MRTYYPKRSDEWQLSRERYMELRAFCKQYPQWQTELADTTDLSSPRMDGMPRGSEPGDPTERAVERREMLQAKIALVERCARLVDDGAWYRALILSCCTGMSYERIRDLYPEALRSSFRFAFFEARRKFYAILDHEKI